VTAEKKVLKGLAAGIGSMKIGEIALLHVNHTLAYGKEGSFSFPNVPPAADVLYEVELIGYEEPREVNVWCESQSAVSPQTAHYRAIDIACDLTIFSQFVSCGIS